MTETTLYGIDTCDQVRRARQWLRQHDITVRFHDFRRDGLDRETIDRWLAQLPWDTLLNRRGLAWRKLDPERRALVVDPASATEALLADPILVKRPVLEHADRVLVGFSEPVYLAEFGASKP